MTVLLLVVIVWALCALFKRPRRRRRQRHRVAVNAPQPVATAYDMKQAERERKAQQRRELAQMELDHREAQREKLLAESEQIENAIAEETGEKRIAQLRRRLEQIDEKIYHIDMATAKAYNIVKYGG